MRKGGVSRARGKLRGKKHNNPWTILTLGFFGRMGDPIEPGTIYPSSTGEGERRGGYNWTRITDSSGALPAISVSDAPSAPSTITPPSPDDVAATARAFGLAAPEPSVTASGVPRIVIHPRGSAVPVPVAPAASPQSFATVTDDDLAATAKALGVNGVVAKAPLPPELKPADLPSHLLPEQEAEAQQRAKTLGFKNAIVEGMPIVGPTFNAATSASARSGA